MNTGHPLLEVKDLSVSFIQYKEGLRQTMLDVITGLNISVRPGEITAIVGSSGSGKSLLAHAVLGVLPANARTGGTMIYKGEELTPKRQALLRGKEIALIPQSVSYLDPLMKVGWQVRSGIKSSDAMQRQRRVFDRYSLCPNDEDLYPHQLSGGMLRRVLVSTAVVGDARLVIADEPTPGLHPEVLEETILHFKELADEGRAVLLITHDIEAALKISDYIAIFYAGTTVEVAPAGDFQGSGEALRHPYTKALWQALPQNGFQPIKGSQPLPNHLPAGCLFEPRCRQSQPECRFIQPLTRQLRGGMVRCNYAS